MDIVSISIQVILLAATGITLWQSWRHLHAKGMPDNEPLGEEWADGLTKRLTVIQILITAEAVVFVIHTILRIFEQAN